LFFIAAEYRGWGAGCQLFLVGRPCGQKDASRGFAGALPRGGFGGGQIPRKFFVIAGKIFVDFVNDNDKVAPFRFIRFAVGGFFRGGESPSELFKKTTIRQ